MLHRLPVSLIVALLVISACTPGGGASPTGRAGGSPSTAATTGGGGATATGGASPSATAAGAASPSAATATAIASPDPNDLLGIVKQRGELRVSTDPNYAPQSFQRPDGTFEGFDIDVATEIAKRLGVKVKFETPIFDLVVAGNWNRRWDVSVGSVTVTPEREGVLDFTQAYYYTPAQLTATKASGITTLEGFAGKTICVASSTTYQFWLEKTLQLPDYVPAPTPPPQGAKASPLETDQLCPQAIRSGRTEFDGWLSSITTVDAAIKENAPIVKVGEPVFFEPLAVATDKNGPPHEQLQAELDRIVAEMHQDGTLTRFSNKWFGGVDFTKPQS